MPNTNSTVFNGSTINLSNFDLGEGPVFVDLDINSAGALTPNNAPSQDGVLRIGEEETALSDVENIIGTDLGERLFGSEEDGFILAGGGDDTVHPFNGDDVVNGGLGVHTLLLNAINGPLSIDLKRGFANTDGQSNAISNFENVTGSNLFSDRISGDRNDNVLSGGAGGDDTLKGKNGDDQLLDEAGEDRLQGGRGDDALFGGADDDLLIGGHDDDTLTGGEGGDRFVFRGRCDDDVITDLTFADGDEIKISGQRLINSEADLISFAERLNEDNKQSTLATIEGDDLRLDTGQSEILIENVASDWAEGLLLA
ncbi:MAG: calcium-binding protein [Paracoccaceae bacterium]|nr:calcium-binding protein [Paracoccaceae bacterium]MDG1369687.1 calcium-binding protein [Paracoccaceae bacterium]